MSGSAPRVRERKKARTRARLFETASRMYGSRGFASVTVAEICRRAEISRGTFFLHFPSKADLLAESARRIAERLEGLLAEPRPAATTELRTIVRELVAVSQDPETLLRPILAEFIANPSDTLGRELLQVIESVVRRGQDRREVRQDLRPAFIAHQLLFSLAALPEAGVGREGEEALTTLWLRGPLASKPRLKWSPASIVTSQ